MQHSLILAATSGRVMEIGDTRGKGEKRRGIRGKKEKYVYM